MKLTSLYRIVLVVCMAMGLTVFGQTTGDDGIASPHPARSIIERPSDLTYYPAHQMDLDFGTFIQGVVTASPGQSAAHTNRSDELVGGIAWHTLDGVPLMAFRIIEGTWGQEALVYSYGGDAAIRIRTSSGGADPHLFIKGTGRRGWFSQPLGQSYNLWREYWSPSEQQALEDFLGQNGRNVMLYGGSTLDQYLNLSVGGNLVMPSNVSRNSACPTSNEGPGLSAFTTTCSYTCGSEFDACSNECPVDASGEPSGECLGSCDHSLDWCLLYEGVCHTEGSDCPGILDIVPTPKPGKGLSARQIGTLTTVTNTLEQAPPSYPIGY